MKLPMLPRVLFDEFPNSRTVKYCFFTQPKFPDKNYTQYSESVTYCGSAATLSVLNTFKKLSPKHLYEVTEHREEFRCCPTISFRVRAIPTGCIGANPVMFLIEVGDSILMYTGRFSQCGGMLLRTVLLHYCERIDDIYVDNTAAAWRHPCFLQQACSQIKQIVSDYEGYEIFLHIDPFGYEHLLYELACQNIKIKLCKVQRFLFQQVKLGDLFHYDGDPQIMVWTRMNDVDEETLWPPVYERKFESDKIIHIKLIACEHSLHWREKIKGYFVVPYTPHANAYELSNLFQTVKPKRVHPLIPRCYADNRMSVIAADLLNDDCEIVENDNFPENHESEDENSVRAFFDTSREISGELSSDEMYNDAPVLDLLSDDDQNSEQSSNDKTNQKQANCSQLNVRQQIVARPTEKIPDVIISLLDDEDDEDDLYGVVFESDAQTKVNAAPQHADKMDVTSDSQKQHKPDKISTAAPNGKNTATDAIQMQTKSVPAECATHMRNDANNNRNNQASAETNVNGQHMQQGGAVSANTTKPTIPHRELSSTPIVGKKRKSMKQLMNRNRIQRIERVKYLSSSDDDDDDNDDENENVIPKKNRRQNNKRPTQSRSETNINQTSQASVQRHLTVHRSAVFNIIQSGKSNVCRRQHEIPKALGHSDPNRQVIMMNPNRHAQPHDVSHCSPKIVVQAKNPNERRNFEQPACDDDDDDSISSSTPEPFIFAI